VLIWWRNLGIYPDAFTPKSMWRFPGGPSKRCISIPKEIKLLRTSPFEQ
jgi:hypothetical protein